MTLMEKIAAKKGQKPKQRKKKPSGGRKELKAHSALMPPVRTAAKPEVKPAAKPIANPAVKKAFKPVKLGLIAAGVAGTGVLVKKIRDQRIAKES